jgi:NAD(P)-dependent dehydrogenase (short-subunit alcohol dehydrogenase family)
LLAKKGAKVVVNDLGGGFDGTGASTTPAQEVVNEIKALGGEAVANYDNVADFQGAKKIIQCAVDSFGKLNILVNNAGILRDRMIFSMSEPDWDAVIAVHLKGTFNCSHHACVYWREQHKAGNILHGRIISTTSDAGLLGNVGQLNYGAAKAAIAAMTIIMDNEMKKYSVTCNAIAPLARTRLTVEATPSTAAIMGTKAPEGKFDALGPQNVSPVVAYLASEEAGDIHGEVFRAGGGSVWIVRGWHSVKRISKMGEWDVDELGQKINKELMAGLPPKEEMGTIFGELSKMA